MLNFQQVQQKIQSKHLNKEWSHFTTVKNLILFFVPPQLTHSVCFTTFCIYRDLERKLSWDLSSRIVVFSLGSCFAYLAMRRIIFLRCDIAISCYMNFSKNLFSNCWMLKVLCIGHVLICNSSFWRQNPIKKIIRQNQSSNFKLSCRSIL